MLSNTAQAAVTLELVRARQQDLMKLASPSRDVRTRRPRRGLRRHAR